MGYKVEINTMLRLAKDEAGPGQLKIGETYVIKRENARIYPVNIPILLLLEDWTVFGYCEITLSTSSDAGTSIRFKLLSTFTAAEQQTYTGHLQAALKETGYLK
jgi:hypothetical protein